MTSMFLSLPFSFPLFVTRSQQIVYLFSLCLFFSTSILFEMAFAPDGLW
jgi:hypothetical protein